MSTLTQHDWEHHDDFHHRCTKCGLLKRFEDFDGNPSMPNPTTDAQPFSLGITHNGRFIAHSGPCLEPVSP